MRTRSPTKSTRASASFYKKAARWALPAAAVFVLFIAGTLMNGMPAPLDGAALGTSQGEARTGQTELVNPFKAVDSAEELKAMLGIDVRLPEGAEDPSFAVIAGKTAQASFGYEGCSYTLRASSQAPAEDLSGLYGEVKDAEELDGGGRYETVDTGASTYKMITWDEGGASYVLLSEDWDKQAVEKVFSRIK